MARGMYVGMYVHWFLVDVFVRSEGLFPASSCTNPPIALESVLLDVVYVGFVWWGLFLWLS